MKISKLLSILLTTVILAGIVIQPIMAQTSDATVSFEEYTGVTDPKDPDDPDENLSEGGGGGTGQIGPLSLDYVSDLAFGKNTISATQTRFGATVERPFVQVTDLRGAGTGWYLKASMSTFTYTENEQIVHALEGANITFKNGSVITNTAGRNNTPPTVADSIVLHADGENNTQVSFVSADDGQGIGTWLARWYKSGEFEDGRNNYVELYVPTGAVRTGQYRATITWELALVP